MLGTEPRALHKVGKLSAPVLQPSLAASAPRRPCVLLGLLDRSVTYFPPLFILPGSVLE